MWVILKWFDGTHCWIQHAEIVYTCSLIKRQLDICQSWLNGSIQINLSQIKCSDWNFGKILVERGGGGGAGEYVVMNRLHKRSIFPYSSSCKSTSIQGKSSLCEDLNLKEARSVAAPVFTHSLEQLDMISCTANSSFWTLINPDFPTRFHFYMHRQWSHGMGRTKFCMDKVESTCIWINQVKRQKS